MSVQVNYRKNRFTKKDVFLLSRKYNWNLRLIKHRSYSLFFKKQSNIRRLASLRKLYSFYSISKRFFKIFYSIYDHKRFSKIHKFVFKKSKKRNYNQSFFFDLERRVCTILFRCRLFSKIKYLKQFVLNKFLYKNNLKVKGYCSILNPLDFVYFNKVFYTKTLLNNFLYKKNFYLDGLYDKYFKKIIFRFYNHLKLKLRIWRSIFLYKIKRRFFSNYSLLHSFYTNNFYIFYTNNFYTFYFYFKYYLILKLSFFLKFFFRNRDYVFLNFFFKFFFISVFFLFILFYVIIFFSRVFFHFRLLLKF